MYSHYEGHPRLIYHEQLHVELWQNGVLPLSNANKTNNHIVEDIRYPLSDCVAVVFKYDKSFSRIKKKHLNAIKEWGNAEIHLLQNQKIKILYVYYTAVSLVTVVMWKNYALEKICQSAL